MTPDPRKAAILSKQTDQLYEGLKLSVAGHVVIAVMLVIIVGLREDPVTAWVWFALLSALSLYRLGTAVVYRRLNYQDKQHHNWRLQFNVGAILVALLWSASLWLFFPQDSPTYQAIMILAMAVISGGAITALAFDRYIATLFLAILLVNTEVRLLLENNLFCYELAALILLYNIFLIRGGGDIGSKNLELLALQEDIDQHNLTLLSATEQAAHIGYWQWDKKTQQLQLSPNLASMCGINEQYVSIDFYLDKIHRDDRERCNMAIDAACHHGEENSVEYRLQSDEDGEWIDMNQVTKQVTDISNKQLTLGTVQDISAIKSAEQKMIDMAYFDDLTGLANLGHFRQHLIEQIKHAERNYLQLAVIYFDLDSFKQINDEMGYANGDLFLQKFAAQLKDRIRAEDFVARIGGDEFSMVLAHIYDNEAVTQITKRCLADSFQEITIGERKITPKISIGIAIYPQDGKDVDSLLKAADTAMLIAKKDLEHDFAFYDAEMTEGIVRRLKLEKDLQQALLNEQFKLVYQPKISLEQKRISGVEALIRWYHPQRGLVSPDDFIATAERIGLINQIGEWVITTACRQLQLWKSSGLELDMAVNVSPSHFSSPNFVEMVDKARIDYGLEKGELEIEITESMSRDTERHVKVCRKLHELGIKIAVDDFGTGYSSLSVLKKLEMDTIKVDRAFINNLPNDKTSVMMAKAIVGMALGLKFDVVAEGVENLEQLQFLQELGCPYIQGYYFSQPVEADEIQLLVEQKLRFPDLDEESPSHLDQTTSR
jgi:diguanylate cyclase (GGDEF)-like protein/PAS domain S-box-containing protein